MRPTGVISGLLYCDTKYYIRVLAGDFLQVSRGAVAFQSVRGDDSALTQRRSHQGRADCELQTLVRDTRNHPPGQLRKLPLARAVRIRVADFG